MANVEQMYASFKKMVENGYGDVEVYMHQPHDVSDSALPPAIAMNIGGRWMSGPLLNVEDGETICLLDGENV